MKIKILVATVDEMKSLVPVKYYENTIITGIGIINVLKTIRECISPDDIVINIGFAGSRGIKVGTVCQVGVCKAYQESSIEQGHNYFNTIDYYPTYHLYTTTDFMNSSNLEETFLVDMELAAYSVLNNKTYSFKVVSDNFKRSDYNDSLKDDYTEEIDKIIEKVIGDEND